MRYVRETQDKIKYLNSKERLNELNDFLIKYLKNLYVLDDEDIEEIKKYMKRAYKTGKKQGCKDGYFMGHMDGRREQLIEIIDDRR